MSLKSDTQFNEPAVSIEYIPKRLQNTIDSYVHDTPIIRSKVITIEWLHGLD